MDNCKKRTLTAEVSNDSVSDSELLAACHTAEIETRAKRGHRFENEANAKALESETLAICAQAERTQKLQKIASKFRNLADTAQKLAEEAAALADEAAELAGS